MTALAAGMEVAPYVCEQAIHVIDGDTIRCGRERLRLLDVDAPDNPGEGRCTPQNIRRLAASKNPPWCNAILYRRSGEELARFLSTGPIRIEAHGRDRYGRVLCRISVAGRDAGEWLVARGLARVWK